MNLFAHVDFNAEDVKAVHSGTATRGQLLAIFTSQTCGEACWHAREDVCRCSCGGKNHGCLRSADGVQPVRSARIDGVMRELKAVGTSGELDGQAREINKAAGVKFHYAHTARNDYGETVPAKLRPATKAQLEKWPELTAYRGMSDYDLYCRNQKPYLLWVTITA